MGHVTDRRHGDWERARWVAAGERVGVTHVAGLRHQHVGIRDTPRVDVGALRQAAAVCTLIHRRRERHREQRACDKRRCGGSGKQDAVRGGGQGRYHSDRCGAALQRDEPRAGLRGL